MAGALMKRRDRDDSRISIRFCFAGHPPWRYLMRTPAGVARLWQSPSACAGLCAGVAVRATSGEVFNKTA
jgi:hypothetical protein